MSKPVYHSITLKVTKNLSEEAYAQLYEIGCAGIVEEDTSDPNAIIIKAYFENHPKPSQILTIASQLSLDPVTLTEIGLNSNEFKPAPYDPFHLTGNYWVTPPEDLFLSTHRPPEPSIQLLIKPGVAFGTGRHQTTRLCASLLENTPIPSRNSLLDVGTGSGILAIVADKLGFQEIEAVEISQEALENARENFDINKTSPITLFDNITNVKRLITSLLPISLHRQFYILNKNFYAA
ncbi:MAG: 50S ribosomal protein L11 methyltransferase [Deltaproteobacteria bacterium]|nr:MAG: 50S ribosomal protein L11 methyltransferase [Deltaproteobacteria bacterium]